ncbi:MAG: GGDEF domain-containing protein [Gammaproteobacteria bacterium]|nr:GGDEF domain-containing protein [Gammaproteobacteria bacterium]
MRLSIFKAILIIFSIVIVLASLILFNVTNYLKTKSINIISMEQSRKQSELIFMNLFTIMKSGGQREDILNAIQKINKSLPGVQVNVLRSQQLIQQYGDIEHDESYIFHDKEIQQVFDEGRDLFFNHANELHFFYPLIVKTECLGCHHTVKEGDINGVLDIRYPNTLIKDNLDDTINQTLTIVATITIILFLVLFLIVYKMIISPIRNLSSHMNEIKDKQLLGAALTEQPTYLTEIKDLNNDYNDLISHLYDAHKTIVLKSETDDLTGLNNRRKFNNVLETEFSRSHRYQRKFIVMMLDLNKFKPINDSYGHAAGDFVLVEFAKIISQQLREQDTVARLGGDEFGVILPETDGELGTLIESRIRHAVNSATLTFENTTLNVSVSIGSACYPEHADNIEQLLSCADNSMYKNKKAKS